MTARPPYIANVSTLPTLKLRREKSESSSIGCGARRSQTMNATSASAPPISGR